MSLPTNPADLDPEFRSFLSASRDKAMALAAETDLLDLTQVKPGDAPQHFLAQYHCNGLVQERDGTIVTVNCFLVGIRFPDDYLDREADAKRIITVEYPMNVFQSNIWGPYVCLTNLAPGTELVSILHFPKRNLVIAKEVDRNSTIVPTSIPASPVLANQIVLNELIAKVVFAAGSARHQNTP